MIRRLLVVLSLAVSLQVNRLRLAWREVRKPPGLGNNQELREEVRELIRDEPSWRRFQEAIAPLPEQVFEVQCRGCPNKFEVRLRLPKGDRFSADFRYTCKECTGTFEAKPKRRMGRGNLVFVKARGGNSRSAELDPEATRSTDQTLTELSLKGANSDNNAAILCEHERAADSLEHIKSGLSAKQGDVLAKMLNVVEPGDSLRVIALKADVHAMQVSRTFAAARKADKQQVFNRSNRGERPTAISYRPYNPRGVPMETVMMPHQGPTLYTINVLEQGASTSLVHPPTNGCCHPNRQWLRVGFGGLRLTCLECNVELDRAGILSKP